ncbi:MAG: hypothetical protein NVSMB9_10780 [Isosphaeraceae bacterium]
MTWVSPTQSLWHRFLPCVIALTCGCAEEWGQDPRVTTRVTGLVREGARPISGGWIDFLPVDGALGVLRSAPLGPDGRFAVEGVAVGKNAIGLTHAPIRLPGGRRLFDPLSTPIRRTVSRLAQGEIEINLLEEMALHDQARRAQDIGDGHSQ